MKNNLYSINTEAEKVKSANSLLVDTNLMSNAALVLRAITHKLRCEILQLIHQEEFINVTDLYLKLGLEQTVLSQHLAILRQAGYVITQREGKCIYYSLNYQRLQNVQKLVDQMVSK